MSAGTFLKRSSIESHPDGVAFGLLYLLLVTASTLRTIVTELYWVVAEAVSTPLWIDAVAGSAIALAGTAAVALVFVVVRGVEIPTGLPDRGTVPDAVLTVLLPVVVLGAMAGVAHLLLGSTISDVTQGWFGSRVSIPLLVQLSVLPALVLGVGYGLLFNGAVQGAIRKRFDAASGIAVVTVTGGFYQLFEPAVRLRPIGLVHGLVLFGLVVLLGYVACLLVRFRAGSTAVRERLTHPQTVVLVLGIVTVASLVADVVMGATELTELLLAGSWLVVFAVAAVGYERTRSIWVPMLSIAVFQLAIGLSRYAEFLYGFASAP